MCRGCRYVIWAYQHTLAVTIVHTIACHEMSDFRGFLGLNKGQGTIVALHVRHVAECMQPEARSQKPEAIPHSMSGKRREGKKGGGYGRTHVPTMGSLSTALRR
eukprot:COSAG01_NODE_15109_length_1372_cov_165.761194_1_plen_103_part_10